MKQISTLILALALTLVCSPSFGQLISGTAVATAADKITVYGKPTANLTNVAMNNISFAFSIADQGTGNNPTATISNNFLPIIPWAPPVNFTVGGRLFYLFAGVGSTTTPTTTWAANTNNPMVEITFSNTNGLNTLELNDLSSGTAGSTGTGGPGQGGGPGSNAFWFVQIISGTMINPVSLQPGDLTNYPQMFYGAGAVDKGPTSSISASSPSLVPVQSPTILPVSFLDFTVTEQGNTDALLSWHTVLEENTDHFVIERSTTGTGAGWSSIGEVKAKGNSNSITAYSYTDQRVFDGRQAVEIMYYRIKSVDLDGKSLYFPVRLLRFSASGDRSIVVFPNPVPIQAGFNVSIPVNFVSNGGPMRLNLLNSLGQLVQSREIGNGTGRNYYFDLTTGAAIVAGEYLLEVIGNGELLDVKRILVMR